jgi:hypothetical protein
MGFRISPQDAFEKAERVHNKINRSVKTEQSKLPTLAEQIEALERLEDENRRKRQAKREEENVPRFAPLYEAKMNSEIKNNKKKK